MKADRPGQFLHLFLAAALCVLAAVCIGASPSVAQSVLVHAAMEVSFDPHDLDAAANKTITMEMHLTLICPNRDYFMDETTIRTSLRLDPNMAIDAPERFVFPTWSCALAQTETLNGTIAVHFAPGLPAGSYVKSEAWFDDSTDSALHGRVPSIGVAFNYTIAGAVGQDSNLSTAHHESPSVALAWVAITLVALARRRHTGK